MGWGSRRGLGGSCRCGRAGEARLAPCVCPHHPKIGFLFQKSTKNIPLSGDKGDPSPRVTLHKEDVKILDNGVKAKGAARRKGGRGAAGGISPIVSDKKTSVFQVLRGTR